MRRLPLFIVLALVAGGCAQGGGLRARIQSEDANERILAIREAAERKDKSAVPLLVDRLEDEDEAVRLFAILALDRITGQRFGYDYGQPADRRAEAVEKWRLYVKDPQRAISMEEQRQPVSSGGSPNSAAADE
jgi:hypothetical protein